jgi:SSS family solute:Na+ symporter
MHRWALLLGWAVGMVYGTWTAYNVEVVGKPGSHFGGPLAIVPFTDTKGYIALTALVINLLVAAIATLLLRAGNVDSGNDLTSPDDYHADAGEPGVEDLPLEDMTDERVSRGSP